MYQPKQINGQVYNGHIKISKAQLRKLLRERNFTGFIVGNRVNRFHFFEGWHLAHRIEDSNEQDTWDRINSFEFYLDKELGDKAAIYLKK